MGRLGIEIELLAPQGRSRRDLAERVAARVGGPVRRVFQAQSEPSLVPGKPVFEALTLGFEVGDGTRFVDDLTLQADLDRAAAPRPGWYRVVSDDARLLRLLARHADPERPLADVLTGFAALFGAAPEPVERGMWRVTDREGASLCIGAPLPGERERPCEIVTRPLGDDARDVLAALLDDARALGFGVPAEGAVHLHVDATPFADAAVLRRLGRLLSGWSGALHAWLGTNPRCRRLGPWSDEVVAVLEAPGFDQLPWDRARTRLAAAGPSKYRDVNIANLVYQHPDKPTVEIRTLPVRLDPDALWSDLGRAGRVLARALDPAPLPAPRSGSVRELVAVLGTA